MNGAASLGAMHGRIVRFADLVPIRAAECLPRAFRNAASATVTIFVVRGSDDPAPPASLSRPSDV